MAATTFNTGVLVYLLLADRAVEIVADRGIDAEVDAQEWGRVCRPMEAAFRPSNFEAGEVAGVQAVTRRLFQNFPCDSHDSNELPDKPVLLQGLDPKPGGRLRASSSVAAAATVFSEGVRIVFVSPIKTLSVVARIAVRVAVGSAFSALGQAKEGPQRHRHRAVMAVQQSEGQTAWHG